MDHWVCWPHGIPHHGSIELKFKHYFSDFSLEFHIFLLYKTLNVLFTAFLWFNSEIWNSALCFQSMMVYEKGMIWYDHIGLTVCYLSYTHWVCVQL